MYIYMCVCLCLYAYVLWVCVWHGVCMDGIDKCICIYIVNKIINYKTK